MKTESNGGSSAESGVSGRLARLYAEELDRAERDFPTMRTPLWDADERYQPRRRMRLRLAAEVAGIVAVVAILVAGGWLALGPSTTPAGPAPKVVILGADGIPTQIDGEHVYRFSERAEWEKLSGSILLGAFAPQGAPSCVPGSGQVPAAEIDLVGCSPVVLSETVSSGGWFAANKGLPYTAIFGWGGLAIVVRVHTHDPEAAGCRAEWRARCEYAFVIESVVWPTVPADFAGAPVYRANDQSSFPTSGSFLLGGRFSKPDFVPPCPMPVNQSAAEQQLLPYCYQQLIDGLEVAPMSNIDEPKNEIVVARVHVNDPAAAQCPAATQADCKAAIVVESVVWRSDELINAMPSSGAAGPSSAASAGASANLSGPSTGTGTGQITPNPSASLLVPPPPLTFPVPSAS
jgi:hypothetical protein